jgi:GNAT superfamily N-acetyltransferase
MTGVFCPCHIAVVHDIMKANNLNLQRSRIDMAGPLSVRKITDAAHLDQMTDWMYEWWGRREGYSYEAVRANMAHSMQEERLPQTYGLFWDDKLVGMYQFTNGDLFPRPDLYPWLANLCVEQSCRGNGFGRFLIESVQDSAKNAGLKELYLFTTHNGLYEKFGWTFVEEIDTFLEPRMQRLYKIEL